MTAPVVRDRWRAAVAALNTWKRNGERAPHKPLLVLLLIARADRGEANGLRFAELEAPLARLMREFGPPRKSIHPEYPFWHLQTDGLWRVDGANSYSMKEGGHSPTKRALLAADARGHVPADLWKQLRDDAHLREELTDAILDSFWPETLHAPLRLAAGLPERARLGTGVTRCVNARDPSFREGILRAYGRRCAVCGYDGHLAGIPLGIQAAHVRWHAYGGPDTSDNGLALCVLHHVALDAGALGIDSDSRILVSADIHGSPDHVGEMLHRFSGRALATPQPGFRSISAEHAAWHYRQVFRAPPRG